METPFDNNQVRPCKQIVANLLTDDFESILEVGCQWGENLVPIRERFPNKKIVGVDIDKPVLDEAVKKTGLDLRVGNLFDLGEEKYDVVFAEALFCMIEPNRVEDGLKELLRVARKKVILVELETEKFVDRVPGGRTGANWIKLVGSYGLEVTRKKIQREDWDANPWIEHGYIYEILKH